MRAAGINLDQPFNDPDDAARYILAIINDVTKATDVEIGGFIYQDRQSFRIYSPIYVGTPNQVPQMTTPPLDVDLVAGFHTHPDRLDFSPGDAVWVESNTLILYMINPGNAISFCVPGASNCIPDGTRQEGTPLP